MKMRITERSKAEFEFYLNTPLDMIGRSVGEKEQPGDPNGYSALECWYALDTYGDKLACREPELLAKATRSKKSVNLQVKLWAEDIADGMLLRQPELVEYTHRWPEWVFRAVMEQAGKITSKTIGFVPRFARAEYLMGNLWFPEMDSFDASI